MLEAQKNSPLRNCEFTPRHEGLAGGKFEKLPQADRLAAIPNDNRNYAYTPAAKMIEVANKLGGFTVLRTLEYCQIDVIDNPTRTMINENFKYTAFGKVDFVEICFDTWFEGCKTYARQVVFGKSLPYYYYWYFVRVVVDGVHFVKPL